MPRIFSDWLTAYEEYADDGFVPPQFNRWAGLSVIAGALERRVWLPWSDSFAYYPKIYVLLVALPGDGKSVALNKAIALLEDVNAKTGLLNIMPTQVTEAKFIELMGQGRSFSEGTTIHFQNAGYYWASEASNGLKNVFGDFIACLTDFYDCPKTWSRATKKDGNKISLRNVCMNMIAGSTFDYLGKLVNDENIMGGFASRLIYIVSRNKQVNDQEFQLGSQTDKEKAARLKYKAALVSDLTDIAKLIGPMYGSPEFGKAWESWYPTYERKRRAMQSEKAQSIMARANPNMLKVAMLLSASESNDRELKLHHWEKAQRFITEIQSETLDIFRMAKANSSNGTNRLDTISNSILMKVKNNPGISHENIVNGLSMQHSKPLIDQAINAMLSMNLIKITEVGPGCRKLKLLGDPDNYL